ncbi:MAG: TIM barrel protein [Spirochaetales bacterium]|nr:TIM barrel protein [Spirochaetales bacterium]
MIIPGLCSVTFRSLSAEKIVSLCADLGIPSIEWGGDIHVSHGDLQRAAEVAALCRNSGIATPSYGSYYRVGISSTGISKTGGLSFVSVLDTAEALGARTVRVWGGEKNFTGYDRSDLEAAAEDTRRIATLAEARGMTVSFEYHENTLTHTPQSLARWDRLVNHPGVRYYWQPPHGYEDSSCLDSLNALGEKLTNIHVFHWLPAGSEDQGMERRPLAEGADRWCSFFSAIQADQVLRSDGEHYGFLEFVRGDDPDQLREDWKTYCTVLDTVTR